MKVYKVQFAVVLAMAALLNLGFYWQQMVVELDARSNLQRPLHWHNAWVWFIWAAAAPAMLWLIRSHPLTAPRWGRSLAWLVAGSLGLYVAVTQIRFALVLALSGLTKRALPGPLSLTAYLHTQWVFLPLDFLFLCLLFGVSYALDYYAKYRQRSEQIVRLELKAAQLESELSRAQLEVLRGHLQPHFLFNAFNAIAMLVRQGHAEHAVEMIARLGDLLRLAIDRIAATEMSLAQEFDFAARYLDIERLRFSDKLRTEIALHPDAAAAMVPNHLLQPLVENAVRLGISRRVRPGCVRLGAVRRDGRLQVEVSGDGSDDANQLADWSSGEVEATRARLQSYFGSDYRCDITRSGCATDIRFDLPFRARPS